MDSSQHIFIDSVSGDPCPEGNTSLEKDNRSPMPNRTEMCQFDYDCGYIRASPLSEGKSIFENLPRWNQSQNLSDDRSIARPDRLLILFEEDAE